MTARQFVSAVRRRGAETWAAAAGPPRHGPLTPVLEQRPLPPIPEGQSLERLASTMRTFRVDDSGPGELSPYADDALWRFLQTWDLTRGHTGRALELGANPYFITWLLREHTDLELTLANYFDKPNGTYQQKVELIDDGVPSSFVARYDHFNLEQDRFPYDDGQFDVVIFCEILEHLTNDPMKVMREIRRVLAPGGTLVLSTPNVSRLANVVRMVQGVNIYDPYSGHGPYGRHNREYNPHELSLLTSHSGLTPDRLFTADAHREPLYDDPICAAVTPLLLHRQSDLGQYVFLAATATGQPSEKLPSFLYRSYPADLLVSSG